MPIVKLSKSERRRLSVFFTCLVLALVAWFITVLSNRYTFGARAVVNFVNFPQKKAFHPLQADTIDVTIEGSGWQMVFSKVRFMTWNITADLKALESKNFIVLSSQLKNINSNQTRNQEIVGFSPDTLYFDFSSRTIKRVPVELISDIKLKKQYAISGDITVKPQYITITGPTENISKIKSWKTDTLFANDVSENLTKRMKLAQGKEGNISIYPKSVEVNVPVEEFTEKVIEIPVKLINNKQYYNVKLYPAKVKVTFTTALTNYAAVNESYFEATVDLDQWKLGYHSFPVQLLRTPPFGKVVKIEPQNIDFIIRK